MKVRVDGHQAVSCWLRHGEFHEGEELVFEGEIKGTSKLDVLRKFAFAEHEFCKSTFPTAPIEGSDTGRVASPGCRSGRSLL